MQYEEIVKIIQEKRRFGQACGREVTEEMLAHLDYPEKGMRIIHIAGTNGKGSTAAFVSSILQAADFVVGQFNSPHLVTFRERIRVNGEMISEADVVRLGERILELPMKRESTMFDVCLGMALLYFREKGCDFVVLETGLGGAKDSTRGISQTPVVCAITNIGLEHTAVLGDTIEEIAREKAGILRRGTPAVLGIMHPAAKKTITEYAKKTGAEVRNVDNLLTKISTMEIALNGVFQRENAALAVGVVETLFHVERGYLLDKYFSICKNGQEEKCKNGCDGVCDSCNAQAPFGDFRSWEADIIKKGLATAKWEGRMETLSREPFFLVDGAHNPQGVEALFNSLVALYPQEKFLFLVGIMADKDYVAMLKRMLPIAERFLAVSVDSARSLQAQKLTEELRRMGQEAEAFLHTAAAFERGRELGRQTGCRVVAFGSLYFIGEIKKCYAALVEKTEDEKT